MKNSKINESLARIIFCSIIVLLLGVTGLKAQKTPAQIWFFGDGLGMDFNVIPPKLLSGGPMFSHEGSASITDENGQLLFYTNGETIWNKNHQVMENGQGIHGNNSSQQAAIIIPWPQRQHLYLVILNAGKNSTQSDDLSYSVVNMSDGLGRVTEKNQTIHTPGTEALAAIGPCNDNPSFFWIMTSKRNDPGKLYSYKVDQNGVHANAVVSAFPGQQEVNFIQFSPLGNQVAFIDRTFGGQNAAQLFLGDFDLLSGQATNFRQTTISHNYFFNQLVFSGDGNWLYVTRDLGITQFETKTLKATGGITVEDAILGTPQLAPDGKIYINTFTGGYIGGPDQFNQHLAVIPEPNQQGLVNNFIREGFFVGTGKSNLGLPSFSANYLFNGFSAFLGRDTVVCSGEELLLGPDAEPEAFYVWEPATYLSDPYSANPVFLFDNYTTEEQHFSYVLTVNNEFCEKRDTINIKVRPAPPPEINGVKSICPGAEAIDYNVAAIPGYTYHWSVSGGTLIAGQGTAAIKIDWGSSNPAAYVKVLPANEFGCVKDTIELPIRINVELDTETPKGPEAICRNDLLDHAYEVTYANGSEYNWFVNNGTIQGGNGTPKVIVNWENTSIRQLWVQEKSVTIDTVCFGVSDTLFIQINPDTAFIHIDYVSVDETTPDHINLQWHSNFAAELSDSVSVFRRNKAEIDASWQHQITLDKSNLFWDDTGVEPNQSIYEYQIRAQTICGKEIQSPSHQTIRLQVPTDLSNNQVSLVFNQYSGWEDGVNRYQLMQRVPGESSYEELNTIPGNENAFKIINTVMTKTHNYRVRAEGFEGQVSWSNEVTFKFENALIPPNVITPNGDGINDTFVIANLEFFPENELIIYNRTGKTVYQTSNYQGLWNAEGLASGIYYYLLKTFEPFNKTTGWLHVLK